METRQHRIILSKNITHYCYIPKKLYLCRVTRKQNNNDMKWNELRRIAESYGWYLLRTGGNHDIYAHPQKEDILKIERHGSKEVKTGLYYKLKRQIGF